MKLRVRSVEGGPTFRVEVPASCDLRTLRAHVGALIGLPPSSVRFSLNKHDELVGPDNALLSSFGICGGDLLFLLGAPSAMDVERPPHSGESLSGQRVQGGQAAAAEVQTDTRRELCAAAAVKRQSSQRTGEQHAMMPAVQMVAATESGTGMVSPKPPESGPVVARPAPSSTVAMAATTTIATEAGASGMETEEPVGIPASPEGSPRGLEDAEDLAPPPALPEGLTSWGSLPDMLCRVLFAEALRVHRPEALLAVAVHAAMLETGFAHIRSTDGSVAWGDVRLPSDWDPARFTCLAVKYTLASDVPESMDLATLSCRLVFQTMGPSLVVYGAVSRFQGNGASSQTTRRLPLSISGHVDMDAVRDQSQGLEDSFRTLGLAFKDIRQLWREIKDGLSVPLFGVLRQRAGLPLPPSFLTMPSEIKLAVLQSLDARSLASMGATCSELRFLAADDDLWRQLFVKDFPDAASILVNAASQGRPPPLYSSLDARSWKAAYGWEHNRRRERARERAQRSFRRLHRFPQPPPGGLFQGPGYFGRPPGIIGGDYDIYPGGVPAFPGGFPGFGRRFGSEGPAGSRIGADSEFGRVGPGLPGRPATGRGREFPGNGGWGTA